MIEQGLIIGLIVLSIWYTMQPGEIFTLFGKWLSDNTPDYLHNPLFVCNVCMSFWYGSVLYWTIFHHSVLDWLITVVVAMGFNIVINKWTPNDPE